MANRYLRSVRMLRVSVLAAFVVAASVFAFHKPPLTAGHYDFDAFYCAARVLSTGADPYRFEPLHSCEAANLPLPLRVVIPSPLPPYAIAVLAPISRIPFPQANLLWLLVLIASAVFLAWSIVELTALPYWLVGACVATALLLEPITNGAMAPLPIALLCGAAVAFVRSRWTLAAIALGLSCLQPHLAFPPILAAFVLVPQMRSRIAIVGIALTSISLIVGQWALNLEYVMAVLPAHAASELGSFNQYSLSAILHLMGFSDRASMVLGSAQYMIFSLLGVALARSLQRELPGSIVLAPLTCAVTGGTFIHWEEISGALPFAFLLAANLGSATAWTSVALIAIPLGYLLNYGYSLAAGLVASVVLIYRRDIGWIGAVGFGLIVSLALWYAHVLFPAHPVHVTMAPVPNGALAEVGWKPMQDEFPPGGSFWWLGHVWAYLGLVLVYWSAYTALRLRGSGPKAEAKTQFRTYKTKAAS